jgi:hypothetical protein
MDNLTFGLFLALPFLTTIALTGFFKKVKSIQPVGWRRLVLGNALALIFFLSTLLLLAEIRFRFFMDTTDSIGFTKLSERWVLRHWHTNGAGFRDASSIPRPSNPANGASLSSVTPSPRVTASKMLMLALPIVCARFIPTGRFISWQTLGSIPVAKSLYWKKRSAEIINLTKSFLSIA